jgi:iron complex transport system ATP-binding protein
MDQITASPRMQKPTPPDAAVELRHISLTRDGHPILREVSLRIAKGSCCAILGPNGAGKSAIVAVLAGFLWPTQGEVFVEGQAFGQVDLSEVRRSIGLVEPSRSPGFSPESTVWEVVATGLFGTFMLPIGAELTHHQKAQVDSEIAAMSLAPLAEQPMGRLSTGEQMKTLLARAMVGDVRVLLLDEPTAGLDMGTRAACVAALERLSARCSPPTLILISHHLDELPRSVDQVVLLKHGAVFDAGLPAQVLTSERLSSLFGCQVDVMLSHGRFVASVTAEAW